MTSFIAPASDDSDDDSDDKNTAAAPNNGRRRRPRDDSDDDDDDRPAPIRRRGARISVPRVRVCVPMRMRCHVGLCACVRVCFVLTGEFWLSGCRVPYQRVFSFWYVNIAHTALLA